MGQEEVKEFLARTVRSKVTQWLGPSLQPLCLLRQPQDLVGRSVTGEIWKSLGVHNGEGSGTPLQYSCLENPMGRGAW